MTDQEVNKASEEKAAEVAPYLSAKKEDEKETSKANTIIPVIVILAVAVTVVASFFEDEYKSIMASLNPDVETVPVSEEVVVAETTEISQELATTPTAVVETKATPVAVKKVAAAVSPAPTTAATQAENQPGLITLYNPHLRPYPQVYAPIPVQVPYGMPQQQARAYTEMMQQRQMAVARMVEMRSAAMQRMEQQHAQAQKAHAEMIERRQAASRI